MAPALALYTIIPNAAASLIDTVATSGATPTLFRSIGTDSTGTLSNAWTFSGGTPTIAANVVTMNANGELMYAGHAEWTDCTYSQRVTFSTGASIGCFIHLSDTSNYVLGALAGASLTLYKNVAGSFTQIATQASAPVNATAYWLEVNGTGTTYTVKQFADAAGAKGAQIGATLSGTISETALQKGKVGVSQNNATNFLVGGAFANVCQVTGAAPTAWTATATWTTDEPAFCWVPPTSSFTPAPGHGALSITVKTASTNAIRWSRTTSMAGTTAARLGATMKGVTATPKTQDSGALIVATGDTTGVWGDFTATVASIVVNPTIYCLFTIGQTGTVSYSNILIISNDANADKTAYLAYGSLVLKRNTLDFTLFDPPAVPVVGDIALLNNPFWITGIVSAATASIVMVQKADIVDRVASHKRITVTAINADAEPAATTAPFNLSDVPVPPTTYGYAGLQVTNNLNSDTTNTTYGSCEVQQPGLMPGHSFALTSSNLGISGTTYTIQVVTVRWQGLAQPVYLIEFGSPMSARTLTGVAP